LTNFGRLPWAKFLEKATEAYNISYHRAINTSPFMLKYGKTPQISIGGKEVLSTEYSKSQLNNMRDTHFKHYQKAIQKGKKEIKKVFQVGDPVLIFNPPLSQKLKEKWHSGYKVIKIVEPDAYIVLKEGKEFRINKSHIKRDYSNRS
ncbi:hypothetical protein ENBRE01_2934, partial [Enteropsectra breve]